MAMDQCFLKSEHPYPMSFLTKDGAPEVHIPRYTGSEGRRSIVALSKDQRDRLMKDDVFKALVTKGAYKFLDTIPDSMRSAEDLLDEARAENARLKEQLEVQELSAPALPTKTEEHKPQFNIKS